MLVEEMEQKQRRKEKNQKEPKAYSNVMMISIRKGEQGEPEGEIIHFNLLNPVPYQGIKDLGFRIDEIARFFNLPESPQIPTCPRYTSTGIQTFGKAAAGQTMCAAPQNHSPPHF